MSDAYYLGQIIITGFGFVPKDFVACNGQLLNPSLNQALFALLGTKYGGDGMRTFGVPDLRGRTPVGAGSSADASWSPTALNPGDSDGAESVTLTTENLPPHTHQISATASSSSPVFNPSAGVLGAIGSSGMYRNDINHPVSLASGAVAAGAAATAHDNMQPFQVLNYCICVKGLFPPRA